MKGNVKVGTKEITIDNKTPPIDTTDVGLIRAQSEVFNIILLVVLAILILMFVLFYIISKQYEKKSDKTEELKII